MPRHDEATHSARRGLLLAALVLSVTIPSIPELPTLMWRLHFGGGQLLFGMSLGLALAEWFRSP
jgi:hypothetical protein